MYSHSVSYIAFRSTEEDQIHNGAILHVAYPTPTIPCLLMSWLLKESELQKAWY